HVIDGVIAHDKLSAPRIKVASAEASLMTLAALLIEEPHEAEIAIIGRSPHSGDHNPFHCEVEATLAPHQLHELPILVIAWLLHDYSQLIDLVEPDVVACTVLSGESDELVVPLRLPRSGGFRAADVLQPVRRERRVEHEYVVAHSTGCTVHS